MTVSPNLKVGKDWRGSLNLAFSVLRRIAFLTPDDFSFGTFDAGNDANLAKDLDLSYYLAIGKLVFVRLYIKGTVSAAPASLTFEIPFTSYVEADGPFWTGYLESGAGRELGFFYIPQGGTSVVVLRTTTAGNWSNGANRYIISNFWYRRQ